MSGVIVTLNSPESLLLLLYNLGERVSTKNNRIWKRLGTCRLRFWTARTPRLSKRHVVNWARDSRFLPPSIHAKVCGSLGTGVRYQRLSL